MFVKSTVELHRKSLTNTKNRRRKMLIPRHINSNGTFTLHPFRPHARASNSCPALGPQEGAMKLQR